MSKLKIPTFSESRHRYDADHRRKQKHRVSILFISKKVSSWNLDRHEKECFLNWILAKSVGGKSLLHLGKFFPMDSAYEIGYVMTYLLLDINHEIIFYSNQTDRVKLISQLNFQEQKIQQASALLRGVLYLVQNYFPLLVSLVELYAFDQVVISRDCRWVGLKFDCVEHSVNGELLLIIVGSMMCILNILNINQASPACKISVRMAVRMFHFWCSRKECQPQKCPHQGNILTAGHHSYNIHSSHYSPFIFLKAILQKWSDVNSLFNEKASWRKKQKKVIISACCKIGLEREVC